jgi:hypothetical protein
MRTLPNKIIAVLASFAPLFSRSVFAHVQVLVCGAILAPGKRTVTSILRVMGLSQEKHFQTYHRVLNRAKWSSLKTSEVLLSLLVRVFAPSGRLVLGIDETLERRQGEKIAKRGIYRDSTRSSRSFFVKSSGLRWVSLMLLASIPWAKRVWALPFLSALAPSERYNQERGRRHKKLSDWARQMLKQVRRWLPERPIVLVADSGYAVLTFLDACVKLQNPVTVVTRLRLDAALYEPAPPREQKREREPGRKANKANVNKANGRPRKKGKRLPALEQVLVDPKTVWTKTTVARWYSHGRREVETVTGTAVWYHAGMPPVPVRWVLIRDPENKFRPQALLCTEPKARPEEIIGWFVLRWQIETTFQQVRAHLGVETQRQWNDLAIERTTPALLGLFSLVAVMAHRNYEQRELTVRQAAWYVKELPTYSDAIASVRRQLWSDMAFYMSSAKADIEKLQQDLLEQFADALCYAA